MNDEWTMADVAKTAIEIGLAVSRETQEIEPGDAVKKLSLLRSKMGDLSETVQAPVAAIAHVEVGGKQVLLADVIEFYRANKTAPLAGGGIVLDELSETNRDAVVLKALDIVHSYVSDSVKPKEEPPKDEPEGAVERAVQASAVTQEADSEPVVEPLIEFDEDGTSETAEFEIDGRALTIIENADGNSAPLKLRFAIIEPGFGNRKMNRYYAPEMLRENAAKFKGAKMYTTNHRDAEKSVRTEVGIILESPVGYTETGGVIGEAGIFDEAFASSIRNRAALGVLGSLENSVYGDGTMRKGRVNGKDAMVVESIDTVSSVDWVTKAGAGGRALEIVENEEDGGQVAMSESVVEEAAVVEVEPSDGGEAEAASVVEVEVEGDAHTAPLAEAAVAETVDKTSLPATFKAALKVREYEDETSLAEAVEQAIADYTAATGSGKPFGQGANRQLVSTPETAKPTIAEMVESQQERYRAVLAKHGIRD